MNLDSIPFVESIREISSGDPVFDMLLVSGPLLIVIIAIARHNPYLDLLARGLAVAYIAVLLGYVLHRAREN